jgi:exodeoxyribonuclease-3
MQFENFIRKKRSIRFWDYFRNAYQRDARFRNRSFLLSSSIKTQTVNAGVDKHVRGWEKTSDHARNG